jgi:hypothetical protein
MTYKKALNDLKRQVEHWENGTEFSYSLPPLKVAIKALKKQIPIKVEEWLPYTESAKCPSCGKPIDSFFGKDFCCWCGQKLLWGSDTE